MDRLTQERYLLRADRNYWVDATLKLKLETLRAAVAAEPRDIARINLSLRSLLLKVVADWENERLILHWRHGGQSLAGFWRHRQKGTVRNSTPAAGLGRRPILPLAS